MTHVHYCTVAISSPALTSFNFRGKLYIFSYVITAATTHLQFYVFCSAFGRLATAPKSNKKRTRLYAQVVFERQVGQHNAIVCL